MQIFRLGALFSATRATGSPVYRVSGWEWATWKAARATGVPLGPPVTYAKWVSGTGMVQLFGGGVTRYNANGPRVFLSGRSWAEVKRAGGIARTGYPRTNATYDGYNKIQRFTKGGATVYSLRSSAQGYLPWMLLAAVDRRGGTQQVGAIMTRPWIGRCGLWWGQFSRSGQIYARSDARWCPNVSYAQPTTRMHSVPSGLNVSWGWGSGKVNAINAALGIGWEYDNYGSREQNAVRAFQASHGLPVTGVVDKATWDALGTGWSWWIDGWQTRIVSSPTASRDAHVEQMIGFAQSQVGAKYIFGGTGPAALGYACSGIVYQALISAGVDPYPMTWVNTAAPDSWGNQAIYRNWSRWQHVPVSKIKRGDLVFWDANRDGYTEHVGIYLGGGRVLDSIYVKGARYGVGYTSLQNWYFGMPLAPYAVRPIADNVA